MENVYSLKQMQHPSTKQSLKCHLVKVPQFLAQQWNSANDQAVLGNFQKCEKTGKIHIKQYISNNEDGCEFISLPSEQSSFLFFQKNSENAKTAEFLCNVNNFVTLSPVMNETYMNLLKKRNKESETAKGRSTIVKSDQYVDIENTQMLFKYYTPKTDNFDKFNINGSSSSKMYTMTDRVKNKGKKMITMDQDSIKMKLFNLFENAGEEGLQLKQIVQITNQPQNYIKTIVDEIAIQKKRTSDRKVTYVLKDYYKSFADIEPEAPMKKPKNI